jgi:hypothetical protein
MLSLEGVIVETPLHRLVKHGLLKEIMKAIAALLSLQVEEDVALMTKLQIVIPVELPWQVVIIDLHPVAGLLRLIGIYH